MPSNSDKHLDETSDCSMLGEVIAEYIRACELGQPPNRDELLAKHPDLADELCEFFANRDQLDEVARPVRKLRDSLQPFPQLGEKVHYFGDYELLEEIGRGGMGVIYKARQVSLDRLVALKMILHSSVASPTDVERFRAEAEAAAALDHANIVPIYEIGEHEGQQYFTMKLIEGGSLKERLDRGPMPPREAARLMAAVAHAVHYAHQHAILHRDLKPANILLSTRSSASGHGRSTSKAITEPMVADFGLAKHLERDSELTQTGAVMGTPSYMSPEQAKSGGKNLTTASDVYSLGAMLYMMLTGRPPFQGNSYPDILRRLQQEEPVRPRKVNPQVDRDLELICLKCLEKDPDHRYAAASSLAHDLERYLAGEPIPIRRTGTVERAVKWARRKPAVAGLTAAVAATLIVGTIVSTFFAIDAGISAKEARDAEGLARSRAIEADDARATAEANADESQQRLVTMYVNNGARRLQEGDTAASLPWFVKALEAELQRDPIDKNAEEIHRTRIATVLEQVPKFTQSWFHDGPVTHAEFSRDGRRVLMVADGYARVWDAQSGEAVTEPLDNGVRSADFSPTADRVVTTSGRDAKIWDAETGELLVSIKHDYGVTRVTFRPDGKAIATVGTKAEGPDSYAVRVWNAATGESLTQAMPHKDPLYHVAFSPNGKLLVTSCNDGAARIWDAILGLPAGPELTHRNNVRHASFGPDGRLVATASGDNTARIWDVVSGRPITPPLQHRGVVDRVVFSPDGRFLATASRDYQARLWDVSTGTALHFPFQHTSAVQHVEFSADGYSLITASKDGTARVWDVKSGQRTSPPLRHADAVVIGSFNSDPRFILTASDDGGVRIWDLASVMPTEHYLPSDHALYSPKFVGKGNRIITASSDGYARLFDAQSGDLLKPTFRHSGWMDDVAVNTSSQRVVTAVRDGSAYLWDLGTGQRISRLDLEMVADGPLHGPRRSYASCFSPDGKRVFRFFSYAPKRQNRMRVWDAVTGKPLTTIISVNTHINDAVFAPDGKRVLFCCDNGSVKVLDTSSGELIEDHQLSNAPIRQLSFSPDGSCMLIVSGKQIGCWDPTKWQPISRPLFQDATVTKAEFSPDGRFIVSASRDMTARIWFAETGLPATPALKHEFCVYDASFSNDARFVITASGWDNHVGGVGWRGYWQVWDAATGQPMTPRFATKRSTIWKALFSPDGSQVLAGLRDDFTAQTWRVPFDSRPLDDLTLLSGLLVGHRLDATGTEIRFQSGELKLADRTVRAKHLNESVTSHSRSGLWHWREAREDARDKRWSRAVVNYTGAMREGVNFPKLFYNRGKAYLSLGEYEKALDDFDRYLETDLDGSSTHNHLAWWLAIRNDLDPASAKRAAEYSRIALARSHNWSYLNTLGTLLYRAEEYDEALKNLQASMDKSSQSGFGHNAFFIAMAHWRLGNKDEARQWYDRATQWMGINQARLHSRERNELVAFQAEAEELLFAEDEVPVRPLAEASTAKESPEPFRYHDYFAISPDWTLSAGSNSYYSAVFSRDGKRIASVRDRTTIVIWETSTGRELITLSGHARDVYDLAFTHDDKRLISAGYDGYKVWDLAGQEEVELKSPEGFGYACRVAVSHDDSRIAVAHRSGAIILDAATREVLHSLTSSRAGWTSCVAFSHDGKRLATSHQHGFVMIWDVETGEKLLGPLEHAGAVHSVAFNLDGNRLATAAADSTARIWDAETGQEVQVLKGHTGKICTVAFSPDGALIATASEDKTVRLWDASSGQQLLKLSSDGDAPFLTAVFSPDGESVLTTNRAGQIQLWRVVGMLKPLQKLPDGDGDARYKAVLALGKIGPIVVPVLIERLEDKEEDARVRVAAANSLGAFGGHARAAIGSLEVTLNDDERKIHEAALQALVRIDQRYAEKLEDRKLADTRRKEEAKLTAAIQKEPKVPKNWILRGRFYTRHQQWRKAASDFEHDLERDPNYDSLRCEAAWVRLAAGDLDEYRHHCQILEARFDAVRNPNAKPLLYSVCSMRPDAVADFKPLLESAKEFLQKARKNQTADTSEL